MTLDPSLTFNPGLPQASSGLRFAPIGLCDMFNGGGAVRSCSLQAESAKSTTFSVLVRGCCLFLAYCSRDPAWASADGLELFRSYDAATGALHLDVPTTKDLGCELTIRFES